MATTEERMQILKMIESGQVTAEEGARLLQAIEEVSQKEKTAKGEAAPRWFRVHVTDMRTGKTKVNVNIPISLVNVGMRLGAKFAPDIEGIHIDEIVQAVKQGVQGKVIDVEDEEDGEHVEIYVE